jgi:type IV pilus assembly protein PilC
MPDFEYRVVNETGRVTTGTAVADTQDVVIEELRDKGFHIIDVRPRAAEIKLTATSKVGFSWEPFGVSERAIVFFTRQLATTLKAGLPLLRAISTLQLQSSSARLRKILGSVMGSLQQGKSLHESLSQHRATFSELYTAMVRVGEASGSLDVTVGRLADILEADLALKRKVKAALAYPSFVFLFSLGICYALIAFLLPNFKPIFDNSGLDIPRDYPITQALIDISNYVTSPWFGGSVVVTLLVGFVAYRWMNATRGGRLIIDTIKFYFPFLQGLIQMAAIARFCRMFGILIRSGVPLLESLQHVSGAAGNMVVSRTTQKLSNEIQAGKRLAIALSQVSLFPPLLVQMVAVGEETATVDTMFERVADYYEQELDAAVAGLTALIEPAMMMFVGVVVCFFVLGVLLPIMGISAAYQRQM